MSVSETISAKSKQYLNDFQNSTSTNWLLDQKDVVMGCLDSAISVSNVFVGFAGQAGIAGFVFDIAEDDSVELGSIITDHYIETGSPVQDHIALRPEKVTVRGLVGEYKDIIANKKKFVEKTAEKLTVLTSYLPVVSQAAGAVFNGLDNIKKSGDNVVNALGNLGNMGMDLFEAYRNINIPQNEQQKAFIFFEALRNAGAVFTVQTPFRYYTNMAIESIRCTQSSNTKDMSRFEVTLKKIRYVDTKVVTLERKQSTQVQEGKTEERLTQQKQPVTDNGQVEAQTSSIAKVKDGIAKGANWIHNLSDKIEKYAKDWVEKQKQSANTGGGSW